MAKPRIGDAEKAKRGTFRADESEDALNAKRAEKVIVGPWLTKIPEPTIPLEDAGRAEYDRLTKLLFESNKLTQVTCSYCELVAVMQQQMVARLTSGKTVSMDLIKRKDSILARLRIAEDAPAIANPNQKNKFASIGTANRVLSAFRLRPSTAA